MAISSDGAQIRRRSDERVSYDFVAQDRCLVILCHGGPRMIFPESICPLCSQVFPSESLYKHIAFEHPSLRHNTIKVIQAYHPSWAEDHGACGPCWRSYRDAGRILNIIKGAKPQDAASSWKPADLAAERPDKDGTDHQETR